MRFCLYLIIHIVLPVFPQLTEKCSDINCSHGCITFKKRVTCACPPGYVFKPFSSTTCEIKGLSQSSNLNNAKPPCSEVFNNLTYKFISKDSKWRSLHDPEKCIAHDNKNKHLEVTSCSDSPNFQWIYEKGQIKPKHKDYLCVTSKKNSKYAKAYLQRCKNNNPLQKWEFDDKYSQIRQPKSTKCLTYGFGSDNSIRVQSGCRISSFGSYLTNYEKQAQTNQLEIGSFNIQIFGEKKMQNVQVVEVLLRIVENFKTVAFYQNRHWLI